MTISRISRMPILFGHFIFFNILLAQAPTIVSTIPAQNAMNLPVDSPITVTFDQNMDATTINASTMVVSGNYFGLISGTYSTAGATTTFTPSSPYMVGERISITVTTSVQSNGGTALSSPFSWEFTAEVLGGLGSFGTPMNFSTGGGFGLNPATAADLDGDGDIDIAVTYEFSNNISVLMNDGSGNYASPINYDPGSVSADCIIAADLNGDGDIDMAVVNYSNDNISVLLNAGSGNFASANHYSAGRGPHAVIASDLDGDGDTDLAVANYSSDSVSVLLNNGSGSFASAMIYSAGDVPISITAADLDGDGDADLAVANWTSNYISVLLNSGSGSYSTPVNYSAGDQPYSINPTDLDGDGDIDLAVTNYSSSNISVLLNNGSGIYPVAVNYNVGNSPVSIAASDLDGDGDADLAVACYGNGILSVLLNNGSGSFEIGASYDLEDALYSVTAADLDWDGDCDLAVVRYSYGDITVLLNDWQNTPPVALNDTISIEEDAPALIQVTHNDTDPEGRPVMIIWVLDTLHASVTIGSDSTLSYLPDRDFWGADSFRYVIADGYSGFDTATVYVTINSVNDAPLAFALLTPIQRDTIAWDVDTLVFSWNRTVDVDSPAPSYKLTITGMGVDTAITTTDTVVVFRDVSIFANEQVYYWDVEVSDGELKAACVETFEFVWPAALALDPFAALPDQFLLRQNYPNPFNPSTTIRFDLPEQSQVHLIIYDMMGREVMCLVEGDKPAGYYQMHWDGKDASSRQVASGIYFARLVTPKYSKVRKMLLVK